MIVAMMLLAAVSRVATGGISHNCAVHLLPTVQLVAYFRMSIVIRVPWIVRERERGKERERGGGGGI